MLWVKGHQDKYTATSKLSQQARMNIRANKLVERHLERNQAVHDPNRLSQATYPPVPGQALQLLINNFVVTQSQTRWIRHQISGYDMRIYLQEKNDWDSTTWDTIDWYGFEKAIKSRTPVMSVVPCQLSTALNNTSCSHNEVIVWCLRAHLSVEIENVVES